MHSTKMKFSIMFIVVIILIYMLQNLKLHILIKTPFISSLMSSHYKHRESTYKILLWTNGFVYDDWETNTNLTKLECDYRNCILTMDRNVLNTSNAVMFNWGYINVNDLPNYRVNNQIWGLFNMEPPFLSSVNNVRPLMNQINLTMTIRQDSDIFVPAGRVFKCNSDWKLKYKFDEKKKSIAWIVSNCHSNSGRELYVKQLQKYIDVDIYGKCGKLFCSHDDHCFEKIAKNYKFYLSFENSVSY